ncbi:hypothetical protein B0T17DRAFT_528450 [Bombardia bombarda]|uniref:Heterokaryon incompatibility domain-containing protein n=1 Tax=Bombardia bombarda TaxID=252184 RepID=A0AA39XBL4_9PEZI|nr:hypothetical protein B0T17DRAFT_528450 [Bombardia bombarda]
MDPDDHKSLTTPIDCFCTGIHPVSAVKLQWNRISGELCGRCNFMREIVVSCISQGIFKSTNSNGKYDIHWYDESALLQRWDLAILDKYDLASSTRLRSDRFEIFSLPGVPRPFDDIPVHELSYDAKSGSSLAQAKAWLSACQEFHQCLPNVPPKLPSRVIDVRTSPVKLHVSRPEETGRYACLSHCWGDVRPPCRTTTETLERNLNAIPWEILPATFSDAIDYTRRLGLDYIWIDSICIIQDSDHDWSEQSAQYIPEHSTDFQSCTVVDVSVTLAGPDPTGEVRSGYLVLSAPFMDVSLSSLSNNGRIKLHRKNSGYNFKDAVLLHLDCPNDLETGFLTLEHQIICLQLYVTRKDKDEFFAAVYLILRQCPDQEIDGIHTYERVGICVVDGGGGWKGEKPDECPAALPNTVVRIV